MIKKGEKMANLYSKALGMINPFVIASSPATQGARNVLKSSKCRPGAIVLRNFGHGSGGGAFIYPGSDSMYKGQPTFHSHGVGVQVPDTVTTLEAYCEEVLTIKRRMDNDIKLWVSIGHYSDIVKGGDWETQWKKQARELALAGADAFELHFNTPGVAVMRDRQFNYYQLIYSCTDMIRKEVPEIPVMVKLAVESCDALTSMRYAIMGGASAVGPTARWKAFYFDLDWKRTEARPGSGYGGTQATPIVCNIIAEARTKGIDLPMFAGGGVFSYDQALRLVMAGSDMVQLGALACSGGTDACRRLIHRFDKWMDDHGYPDIQSLQGDALTLYTMPGDFARGRQNMLGAAYKERKVDKKKCIGCGRCVDVCWHEGVKLEDKKAVKLDACIGCGYCFQVCPTEALYVDKGAILASAFEEK
jgi:dihydropyrimidine dehydrogenase (NAD+) subunit PreA